MNLHFTMLQSYFVLKVTSSAKEKYAAGSMKPGRQQPKTTSYCRHQLVLIFSTRLLKG